VIVCVPTPLNRVQEPDLSHILDATSKIKAYLHKQQLVILESTTYPGTTDEVILKILSETGLQVGRDFFLCFSSERIDPGNKKFPAPMIPKVIGGITPACTKLGSLLYGQVFYKVVTVSSARTAEMAKLLENTFRIINIGLINELATIARSLKVDIWEVIDAAKTKPFGYMPFYPGPGVGGHCIGIDPMYLSWKAKKHGFNIRFIELAREINMHMPDYVVDRIQSALARKHRKAIQRSKILVLGVTYKRDVDDTRESPAFEIIKKLISLGANVSYHDPFVPKIQIESHKLKSQQLSKREVKSHDLVLILTDHSAINYGQIAHDAKSIFDTRNVMKRYHSPNVIKM